MAKPQLLTEYDTHAELAKSLGVCPKTLDRWRLDGAGPPITKIGRKLYYHRASVEKWLRSQEQASKAA